MTDDEIIDLLTTAAAFDRRKVGQADVVAWRSVVGDLSYLDSQDAVIGHYTESTDWLMPAHVRVRVKAIRTARLAREVMPTPPAELTDDTKGYREEFRRSLNRLASGWSAGKALARGQGAEPRGEYLEGRGEDPERREIRLAAEAVQCPRCKALTNERCVDSVGLPLASVPAHDARLVAAGLAVWVEVNGQQRAAPIAAQAEAGEIR